MEINLDWGRLDPPIRRSVDEEFEEFLEESEQALQDYKDKKLEEEN